MKNIITGYTFNAAAKTVDLSSISGFDIKRLMAIVNVKTGTIIYAVGDPATGYASIAGSVVTLTYDTTAMNNSDALSVIYDQRSEGIGDLSAVPAGTTNGTAIATIPSNAKAVRFYLPAGASVTFTISGTAPSSAPSVTFTIANSTTGYNWDEPIPYGMNIYVTAISGSPLFRIL